MSKKNRIKRKRKEKQQASEAAQPLMWMENDGVHALTPYGPSTPEELKKASEMYQKRIRNSSVWTQMVEQFGKEKAREMLKQFQVELR